VDRVHAAEGLHREEEDQFEMRHPAGQRPALEGGDETFAGGHGSEVKAQAQPVQIAHPAGGTIRKLRRDLRAADILPACP
jgi:hypothetical protein